MLRLLNLSDAWSHLTPQSRDLIRNGQIRLKTPKCDRLHDLSDSALVLLASVPTLRKWRILMIHDGKPLYPATVPHLTRWRAKWHFMKHLSESLMLTRNPCRRIRRAAALTMRSRQTSAGTFSRGFRDEA